MTTERSLCLYCGGPNEDHVSNYYCKHFVENTIESLRAEVSRLSKLINSPELHDFAKAVALEAAHQRNRWGTEHDQGKSPEDWLWLVAYLATKAAQAHRYGDREKYLHHIITAAAACANWHAHASGADTSMRPGSPERPT